MNGRTQMQHNRLGDVNNDLAVAASVPERMLEQRLTVDDVYQAGAVFGEMPSFVTLAIQAN